MVNYDEVLKGLKCHTGSAIDCLHCPYHKKYCVRNRGCTVQLANDVIRLLESLNLESSNSTTEELEIKPTKSSQKIIDVANQLGLIAPEYWCGNCGYNLINYPKYCENCGKKVKWDD